MNKDDIIDAKCEERAEELGYKDYTDFYLHGNTDEVFAETKAIVDMVRVVYGNK